MKNKKYKSISLFCGAGGLDLGFEREGFQTIWANDIDKDACETHAAWSNAEVFHGDITEVNPSELPDCDIVLGGFPCQGFSLAGPRKLDDNRNKLYQYFVKIVETKQPLAFVGENVKGLLTLGDGEILKAIIEEFETKGYNLYHRLVNASDYGVPQDRQRVILVGIRKDLDDGLFRIPDPTGDIVKMQDILKNLPEPKPEDVCNAPYSSRYMSRNRKRDWETVSYTIPAMAKQVALHPSSPNMIKKATDLWEFGKGQTRRFSWQEAALIQTFPQGMEFAGNLTSKYKQIGNAVPVKLAQVIAKHVYNELQKLESNNKKELVMI